MMHAPTNDPKRRLHPHIFNTDWLILKGMARTLEKMVAEHVRPNDVVLDFGCGQMPYRPLIEGAGATYLGADFGADAAIGISEAGRLEIDDSSADVVLSVQVLEHVRDLAAYFGEIRRVLKPGGTLLLSTHGTWLYHPHPEDHRRWTGTGLVAEITAGGFDVDEIDPIVGPLATTTLIRQTGFAYVLDRVPVIGRLGGMGLTAVMNTRALLEDKLTPEAIRRNNACVYFVRARRSAG